jgi:hypothetical protein
MLCLRHLIRIFTSRLGINLIGILAMSSLLHLSYIRVVKLGSTGIVVNDSQWLQFRVIRLGKTGISFNGHALHPRIVRLGNTGIEFNI